MTVKFIVPTLARIVVLLLLAVLGVVHGWRQAQPVALVDAPSQKFACLSYTPRGDRTEAGAVNIKAQIELDMQQLAARTNCVRTYSVTNGLDYVPVVARQLHMRVLLGLWIGSDYTSNERELNLGIATANANRDVIDAVVVGNEVLLRREQTAAAMLPMLERVKNETGLPVTYADVWDFWLKNPQLAQSSDFVTIHILPYWDDLPIGIEHAMAHVEAIYNKVHSTFPGKPIYVGETGWPSAGRQREGAVPSTVNQARFTRDFIAFAAAKQIPYNFIEAYDQPWKRRLEGTVGGYWGLYDADGNPKFALTGSVRADVDVRLTALLAFIGALLCLALSIWRQRNVADGVAAVLMGVSAGIAAAWQWDYALHSCRNHWEWAGMGLFAAFSAGLVWLDLLRDSDRTQQWRGTLWLLLLMVLAYINLGLTFDGRYRDFPTVFVVLPVVTLMFAPARVSASWQGAMWLFSIWLGVSALLIAVLEKFTNHSALLWCALCLSGALRWLWLQRATWAIHQVQRAA